MNFSRINSCRVCGNRSLISCIDLGDQYLSSIFPDSLDYRSKLDTYPLELVLCEKEGHTCGLLQLAYNFDLSDMYKAYPYTSSSNSAMKDVLFDVAAAGANTVQLKKGDVILDVGGNDNSLLSYFKNKPFTLVSIDPAINVESIFQSPRLFQNKKYFNTESYNEICGKKAKLIFSVCMFYHLHEPLKFAADIKNCLDENGVAIIQMAYMPAMLETNMFDNIVHEHAGYYSTHHMKWIFDKVGLEIFNVVENDVYGGSFRVFLKHSTNTSVPINDRVHKNLLKEESQRLNYLSTYFQFGQRISDLKLSTIRLILNLKKQGKKLSIFGASTKGNTILQYYKLNNKHFDYAFDCNSFKYNKYLIGSDIKIRSEEEMRKEKIDFLFSLPYAFTHKFVERESKMVQNGTRFIKPLPSLEIV